MSRRQRLTRAVATSVAVALLAGCGPSLASFGIGRGVSGGSYPLTVVFDDATGLPIGGHVELHDVTVGRVQSMQTRDFKAYVHVNITSSTTLPRGTHAELALTTPLGEEYVDLIAPVSMPGPALRAGAVISAQQTTRSPDVENLLGAFSAILNGGGIEQIKSIVSELDKALSGRAAAGHSLITSLNHVLSTLADHTTQIDGTLKAVNTVTKEFAGQRQLINRALTRLAPGVGDLATDTAGFTRLATHLARLGRTATTVLDQVQGTLVNDLRGLGPTLDRLVLLRPGLRGVLTGLRRFAFLLDRAIPGDFLNLTGSIVSRQP